MKKVTDVLTTALKSTCFSLKRPPATLWQEVMSRAGCHPWSQNKQITSKAASKRKARSEGPRPRGLSGAAGKNCSWTSNFHSGMHPATEFQNSTHLGQARESQKHFASSHRGTHFCTMSYVGTGGKPSTWFRKARQRRRNNLSSASWQSAANWQLLSCSGCCEACFQLRFICRFPVSLLQS